jgi:hypothetical protein
MSSRAFDILPKLPPFTRFQRSAPSRFNVDDPRLRVSESRVNCAGSGERGDNAPSAKIQMTGIQIGNNG